MNRLKVICYLVCMALLLMFFGGLVGQPIALALSEATVDLGSTPPGQEEQPHEEVELNCKYPKLSSYAGTYFAYDIEVTYKGGEEPRLFDLHVNVPAGFNYSIGAGYGQEGTEIAAVRLDPTRTYAETIKVTVRPYIWLAPEPGEYAVTVEASSGELKDSIELTAIVTAKYDLELETSTGRLNAEATAGQDNYSSIVITNTGSADLENINFESEIKGRPSGWSVTFSPEEIDSLPLGGSREVEVNIKPARKTISGDYMMTISSEPESKYAFDSIDIRVTVLTPTIWGWVGVGIVVLVIVGLAWMFIRLGRR
jgi:uncharacterized membrane protein